MIIDFESIIKIFNSKGKETAANFVENIYGVPYINIQRKIKKETNYRYNRHTKKYEDFNTLSSFHNKETIIIKNKREDNDKNNLLYNDGIEKIIENLLEYVLLKRTGRIIFESNNNCIKIKINYQKNKK